MYLLLNHYILGTVKPCYRFLWIFFFSLTLQYLTVKVAVFWLEVNQMTFQKVIYQYVLAMFPEKSVLPEQVYIFNEKVCFINNSLRIVLIWI